MRATTHSLLICLCFFVFFPSLVLAVSAPPQYKIIGTCGGYPRIDVKTAPGFCVGQVYDGSKDFKKLRWIAPLSETSFVLTDMGNWVKDNGRLFVLNLAGGRAQLKLILSSASFPENDPRRGIINEPNQVSVGPDGLYYVGAAGGLYRFNPRSTDVAASVAVVIDDLPSEGLHPLKTFAFDEKGGVYINIGSATNDCENQTSATCAELENPENGRGQIRRYQISTTGQVAKDYVVFAKGLRNSIALTWDSAHQALLESDNGRDAIDKLNPNLDTNNLPHEAFNIITEPGHQYGWPYCYDDGQNNPEWPNVDCRQFQLPSLLIPAHAAPLGMIVYRGHLFPKQYQDSVLLNLHGYAANGHRLVTFAKNTQGLPQGLPLSLVYNWEKRGLQEEGKPVGLVELQDGSVMLVEDSPQNKVLRLFYDPREGNGAPVAEIGQTQPPSPTEVELEKRREAALNQKLASGHATAFTHFEHEVIDQVCYKCHAAEGAPGAQMLRYDEIGNEKRIQAAGLAPLLLQVLQGQGGAPQMPPQGWDNATDQARAIELIQQWLANPVP